MSKTPTNTRLYAPRHWGSWLIVALLWSLSRLPFGMQIWIGRGLGRLLHRFIKQRRHIVEVNIDLCFPESSKQERATLIMRNFESMGISLLEMAMSWWTSEKKMKRLVQIEGMDNLNKALEQGNGALLLSAHFTTLEIGGRLLSMFVPFQALYREHKNPVMEYVMTRGRNKFIHRAILRGNLLGMRRSLKQNIPVWYAPDQDFGIGKGIFVPFFGIPAATITATSTLAKMVHSPVVPFVQTRLPGSKGYALKIYPALENFPGKSVDGDTRRINELLEQLIREHPEQYLWAHRRFKTRPEGMASFYE